MNQDVRNQAIILTADGIPCFKNKNASRGVVPVCARTTMKDALGLNVKYTHLVALCPDQHWVINPATGRKKRSKKKTSFLTAITTRLTDELLTSYTDGVWTLDHSFPEGHPRRLFLLRCILLYWIGDYPGIAEAACTMASGGHACHWCKQFFAKNCAINRVTNCDFRPHLPVGDPYRSNARSFHSTCTDPIPAAKTHQEMCEDAEASEAFEGGFEHPDHPRFTSAVCYICPLAFLPLWDMVWDFMGDFMHILEGYIKSHMMEVLKGNRYPAAPQLISEVTHPGRDTMR